MIAATETGEHWLQIPLSESPASLALVWRDGTTRITSRVLTVPDGGHEGEFRIVNLAGRPMALTWGSEKIRIYPAVAIIKQIPQELEKISRNN